MALKRSKVDKAIKALEKQQGELLNRRERLTKRLFETMLAYKKVERLIADFQKLREDHYARAKAFLVKNDKESARSSITRAKGFDSRIARSRQVGELVEMMKGQVWDVDIAVREIGVDIEFVRATGEIEEQALFDLGTRVDQATRKALEQTDRLGDTIKTVKEMEVEGLAMKAKPSTSSTADPEVEKELEKLFSEVEAKRVTGEIAEMEPGLRDLEKEN